ncbi:flagellar hook-basal body complex protein [Aestuariivita sp.]|jgi:flagellar hook protein FlgE|uniref:flagellar hook protein FlgE n=1 Tax=Aestuariivita sp. TaxID=1872407 RepID=UPI002172E4AC|nr:flagellar hook-basal body complex protein [Aestuariivita sp.]MCE8008992.1 flagellar hook-basal body complex protein [Aestuariivita sp.]
MSISSAFQTGVSGLQANSKAVGAISENIANANTVGYRRGFSMMVTNTASAAGQTGVLTVRAEDLIDMNNTGDLISTGATYDMAISGNGFFNVSLNPNDTRESNYLLTRAGSFLPDADGNLVNAAGYYLAGYRYGTDGSLPGVDRSTFGQMETVNIANVSLSATPTTAISVFGNLPAQESGGTTPGSPFVSSTEYFTALGASQRVEFSWQPTADSNIWQLTLRDGQSNDLGSVTVNFNDTGALAGSPASYGDVTSLATAPSGFAFDTATGTATLTIESDGTTQTIDVSIGGPNTFDGISQFTGDFSQSFDKNGSSTGTLARTEIESGVLYGVFTNGNRRPLYEIPLSVVENPYGLIESSGNAYILSVASGEFQAQAPGSGSAGTVVGGALEASNVDIAEELTDLIQVQRAYSTNATVVTTADEIMEETTRLKR